VLEIGWRVLLLAVILLADLVLFADLVRAELRDWRASRSERGSLSYRTSQLRKPHPL